MNSGDQKKLDNPVWYSLTEAHRNFVIDYGNMKFYHPDYCPFGAFEKVEDISKSIYEYSKLTGDFYIVGEKPELPDKLKFKKEVVCLQMVVDERIHLEINEDIRKLNDEHADDLFDLVNLVQPGYYRKRTNELGDYFGIFKDDILVATTGERMQMNDFVEVSGIVTHPDHTRKGYAGQLTAYTANRIFDKNKTPYLHVAENNTGAVKLYEKLGFKVRRKMSFRNITK